MLVAPPYAGRRGSLATKHDKLPLVAPPMAEHAGLEVFVADVDTDEFGTFTGEVDRVGSPLETATAKARRGMEASGASVGLASEGSIGSGPLLPAASDMEIVVVVDDAEGFVLAESFESFDVLARSWVTEVDGCDPEELRRAGFPDHGLIVRPEEGEGPVRKGIHGIEDLERAIRDCRAAGARRVRVESDLRANHSPTRRPIIARAATRLARRLAETCPACRCPGWGQVDVVRGRPCADCGRPTRAMLALVSGCARCDERRTGQPLERPADPATCDHCNP